jgi:hypothetical protein
MNAIQTPFIGASGRRRMLISGQKEWRRSDTIRGFDLDKAAAARLVERKDIVTRAVTFFVRNPTNVSRESR